MFNDDRIVSDHDFLFGCNCMCSGDTDWDEEERLEAYNSILDRSHHKEPLGVYLDSDGVKRLLNRMYGWCDNMRKGNVPISSEMKKILNGIYGRENAMTMRQGYTSLLRKNTRSAWSTNLRIMELLDIRVDILGDLWKTNPYAWQIPIVSFLILRLRLYSGKMVQKLSLSARKEKNSILIRASAMPLQSIFLGAYLISRNYAGRALRGFQRPQNRLWRRKNVMGL